MSYKNALGQDIEVGDIVTHTTASAYESLSVGFVRKLTPNGRNYADGTPYVSAGVTWVNHGWRKATVKTTVALSTVTRVDPYTLSQELQKSLVEAQGEGSNA